MSCPRCHDTGEIVAVDPSGREYSLPCDACELREWIERAMKAEAALVRERRRVRQRQRGLYQWGAVWWDECATLAFGRDDRETANRLVARSNRLFDMARDRSHDDE